MPQKNSTVESVLRFVCQLIEKACFFPFREVCWSVNKRQSVNTSHKPALWCRNWMLRFHRSESLCVGSKYDKYYFSAQRHWENVENTGNFTMIGLWQTCCTSLLDAIYATFLVNFIPENNNCDIFPELRDEATDGRCNVFIRSPPPPPIFVRPSPPMWWLTRLQSWDGHCKNLQLVMTLLQSMMKLFS